MERQRQTISGKAARRKDTRPAVLRKECARKAVQKRDQRCSRCVRTDEGSPRKSVVFTSRLNQGLEEPTMGIEWLESARCAAQQPSSTEHQCPAGIRPGVETESRQLVFLGGPRLLTEANGRVAIGMLCWWWPA
jgi:hypothetical protein